MATSSKDIETLWKQFQTGAHKSGISVRDYFEKNGIPYHVFEKWYKSKFQREGVVECEIRTGGEVVGKTEYRKSNVKISVELEFSDGLHIHQSELTYESLIGLILKLDSLCSA